MPRESIKPYFKCGLLFAEVADHGSPTGSIRFLGVTGNRIRKRVPSQCLLESAATTLAVAKSHRFPGF